MQKKYKLAVFIGRFQPLHNGHVSVIEQGLKIADRVLVLVGSSTSSRNIRNPFSYNDRAYMIEKVFPRLVDDKILIASLRDFTYNQNLWVEEIQEKVNIHEEDSIVLIGHSKDKSSYYLKLFPQWASYECENVRNINATEERNLWFNGIDSLQIPDGVKYIINSVKSSKIGVYKTLKEEYEFVKKYKKAWEAAPYPPTFVTVDTVVVQSGHVLCVKRGAMPGKGLWAMPGGFINQDEFIIDAAIRELKEETKIKVPTPVLYGNVVESGVFDDPNRSLRGRTVTHAFLIKLPDAIDLPKVKGSDDAEHAAWLPFASLIESEFYEDHFHIIQNLIKRI